MNNQKKQLSCARANVPAVRVPGTKQLPKIMNLRVLLPQGVIWNNT